MDRRDIVRLDKAHVWHPYTPMGPYIETVDPLVIASAQGATLVDVDGRRYLDANSSWWTTALGHNHPRLVAALKAQADRMSHVALAGITHAPAAALAEALVARAPRGLTRVFYSDDGSTALECGLKMALKLWHNQGNTRRTRFAALVGAFHGETLGVTALGGVEVFRQAFASVLMDCVRIPAPTGGDVAQAVEALLALMEREGDSLAAVVVEPLVLGANGMQMYAPEYLRAIRDACTRHDVLLFVDEVFTGYGRTGSFWACDQAGVVPDLLAVAKGFTSGILPMAATLATERIFEAFLGAPDRAFFYGHSFAGHALGCAVAREVLRVYEEEAVIAGIPERSALIGARFRGMAERFRSTKNPRSLGMIGAVDLDAAPSYLADVGKRVGQAARARGVYLRPLGSTVYVAPPLNIALDELDTLLEAVEESIAVALEA